MDYKSKEDAIIFPYLKNLYTSGKIVDVGCKTGKWSLYLQDTIPEENWLMFDAIKEYTNSLSTKYTKSKIYNITLSDTNQLDRKFIVDKTHYGHSSFTNINSSTETRFLESRRLDEYNFDDIWLIKIDTEGHELPILKGARGTILRNKPFLYFECYHKIMELQEYTQKDLFDYVISLGYVITNIITKKELSYEEFNEQTFSDKSTEHNFLARVK
jgi:FkbM family methyltransferase